MIANVETEWAGAAERGDTETIERLLRSGLDVDSRNHRGETALHLAVRHRHSLTAACLLAYGADHRIADQDGRTPLSLEYTNLAVLHAIRQRHRRFRRQVSDPPAVPERVASCLRDLEQRGIARVPGLVSPDVLARMQDGFAKFTQGLEGKMARGEGSFQHYDEEEHWWPKDRAYVTNNAFKHSIDLVRWCCEGTPPAVTDGYLGRTAHVSRGVAMRYLPAESSGANMFGWHHDMEDQRLKMMVLLTDVGENDQAMSYVVGSHRLYHPLTMFLKNQCSLEYCGRHLGTLEIFDTVGRAGDVFFFDSNGAHRGNRRPGGRVRDAFFVEYTVHPSDVWGGHVPVQAFTGLELSLGNPFDWMMTAPKRWDQPVTRVTPTWIESLPRMEAWR